MQTILSVIGVSFGLAAAGVCWLTIAQWPVMRAPERHTAAIMTALLATLAAGVTLYARGLS